MMAMTNETAVTVRWKVIGFEVRTYQACADAPVQPGGSCDKCGQGIKYVYRVKSNDGRVMEVGSDCAVTLEGGPELAELRNAERAYEREQYLKSDEYARICADRESRKERLARTAIQNETDFAIEMAGLRAVVASTKTSQWERDYAAGKLNGFKEGTRDYGMTAEEILPMWKALCNVFAAESNYVGAVGQRDKNGFAAVLETLIQVGIDSPFGPKWLHKFRTSDGGVLIWFASGLAGAVSKDIGKTFTVVGTVKEHSVRDGVKQTILTRVKLAAK